MNKPPEKETYIKLVKKHINLLVRFGFLSFLTVGFISWAYHTKAGEREILGMLLRDLAITFWIIGFVGLFYEILMRRRFEQEMADTLWKSIDADVSLLKKKIKDEAITSIIKNSLEAKLCNKEMANIFYEGLILPYIGQENFRDKFEYKIWLQDMEDVEEREFESIKFNKDYYLTMSEHLEYTKRLNLKKGQQLKVAVCFEDQQLQSYLGDKCCIYRIIIRIRDDTRFQLTRILEQRPEILNQIFSLEIELNNAKIEQERILAYREDKGVEIVCKYKGDTKEEAEIKVRAKTVRDKKVNFYTAYIFDPTFNPQIMFNYNTENIIDVLTAEYYTSKNKCEIERDDRAKFISAKVLGGWVFPTSGVVFIWKVCK